MQKCLKNHVSLFFRCAGVKFSVPQNFWEYYDMQKKKYYLNIKFYFLSKSGMV